MSRIPDGTARIIETKIGPESEGVRLDHYLQDRFTYRSRSAWQIAVRAGEIKLNGTLTRPSRPLHCGDVIAFLPQDVSEPEVDASFEIIHECPEYIVVNKPGQLPAHPSGRFFKHTLWFLLRERFGDVHIVNRLDRETSGVTVAARSGKTAAMLSELFAKRETLKIYTAIVHGRFPESEVVAEGFLSRDASSIIDKKRRFTSEVPADEYETAKTVFRLIATNGVFSIVEATPKTGRLHQIRATLCSLGFPLAGDKLYGLDDSLYLKFVKGTLSDADIQMLILRRQALHASRLEFMCPFKKRKVSFSAPIPNDISDLHEACNGV